MVLQYGFVVLFVSACPLVPLLALANNILEVHVDAYKLVHIFRRPWPYAAMNIGQWAVFMDLLSSISVVTNIGIVIKTSNTFDALSDSSRWLLFIVAEHGLLAIKYIVSELIDDVPRWVDQLHRRHHWIATKLKGMKGADHDDTLSEIAEQVDVRFHENSHRFAHPVGDSEEGPRRSKKSTKSTKAVVPAAKPGKGEGKKLII